MKRLCLLLIIAILISNTGVVEAKSDAPSSWAVKEVNDAIKLGLVPNSLKCNYNQPITRAEFVELIMQLWSVWEKAGMSTVSAQQIDKLDIYTVRFSDCNDKKVLICAALGIVDGTGKNSFMPNGLLTRQQAAKILHNACQTFANYVTLEDTQSSTAMRGVASFWLPHNWTDGIKIRSWARDYINWCFRHNIMSGIDDNMFDPDGEYTREQAILTVLRLYYANGHAEANTLRNKLDYYPIFGFGDHYKRNVKGWIDSTLQQHSVDEVGIVTDKNKTLLDVTGTANTQTQPNKARIESKSGWYRIVKENGSALSESYANALLYVGDNLYIGWVSDNPRAYDIIFCDGVHSARIIRKEEFRFNNHVFVLGGGLYAVQNTDYRISVFDSFGDTIGTINSEQALIMNGSAGGLLWVTQSKNGQDLYYTPNGVAVY